MIIWGQVISGRGVDSAGASGLSSPCMRGGSGSKAGGKRTGDTGGAKGQTRERRESVKTEEMRSKRYTGEKREAGGEGQIEYTRKTGCLKQENPMRWGQ